MKKNPSGDKTEHMLCSAGHNHAPAMWESAASENKADMQSNAETEMVRVS